MNLSRLERLGRREKTLLGVAALVAIAALADRFVVATIAETLRDTKLALENERERLAYNEVVAGYEPDVRAVYEGVKDGFGACTTPAADIDIMKGEIDDLVRKSGLVVRSMKHREPRILPHYVEYTVDIGDFEGSMESLLTFLNAVRNSDVPGLPAVTRLTVSAGRESEGIKGAMTITKVMTGGE